MNKIDFLNKYEMLEDEYIDKRSGEIFCSNCNTSRLFVSTDGLFATKCLCDCKSKEQKEIEKQKEVEIEFNRKKNFISKSFIGERFKLSDFKNIDTDRPTDFLKTKKRCEDFVKNWKVIKEKGQGFYLYGSVGTGKSMLTACIGNALMEKFVPVLFTSFVELSKQIRNTYKNNSYETEIGIIKNIADVDLLIIDDIGTERVVKDGADTFMQEKIYEIINARYENKKSTIFTSNYSMEQLITERGMEERTIDRINEMSTAVMELKGSSYRNKLSKQKAEF